MARNNHTGNRSKRDTRTGRRNAREYRRFIIVTDAKETEINYMNGIKQNIRGAGVAITVKQENTQANLVKECLRLANTEIYSDPELWILFDHDEVGVFDNIVMEAKDNGVDVAWSNPCIEIWFWAYFEKIPPYTQSDQCISEFKNIYRRYTHVSYRKNDPEIYKRLLTCGSENKAIERAEKQRESYSRGGVSRPSQMAPGTTVDTLVRKIRGE